MKKARNKNIFRVTFRFSISFLGYCIPAKGLGLRSNIASHFMSKLRKKLDVLAEELLQKETLEGEEFERLIGAKPAKVTIKA